MQAAGNATCGGSRFKAGRSDGRKNDSKNAKGMEMMTCSHGLIKGMASLAHAETYKHTHLKLLIASKYNATFFCNDVICKFFPLAENIARLFPEYEDFLRAVNEQEPFMSPFHGLAHDWPCRVINKLFIYRVLNSYL